MRFIYTLLLALALFSFSGAAEILPEFFGDKHEHCSVENGDCDKEDQSENEGTNEQEDEPGKESIVDAQLFIFVSQTSNWLSIEADALRQFSYSPEDHSPPPELI